MRNKYIVAGLFALALVFAGSAYAANAANPNDNTRPGWGNGDDNFIHVGPPGLSVRTPPPGP